MTRELHIQNITPSIIEPDRIGLTVEAALIESGIAIPNVTFEVQFGVYKAYEGKSDAVTGLFVGKNIPVRKSIDACDSLDVVILARDEIGEFLAKTSLDVKTVMKEIEMERFESEKDAVELAEKERVLKNELKKALDQLLAQGHLKMESGGIEESLKIIVENAGHPMVQRKIVNIAEQHPCLFIICSSYYEASWAEAVLSKVAGREPLKILEKLPEFCRRPWAKNIIIKIAEQHPDIAFSKVDLWEYMPWAEGIAMKAAVKNPKAAIEHYEKYRDQPWATTVLAFARKMLGERN